MGLKLIYMVMWGNVVCSIGWVGAYGDGGGWGMEEEKNGYGEEDNEEKSGAQVEI